jgi:hypothetical protein
MAAMSAPAERALRWYPAAWRDRYGDELQALMEDTYGAGRRVPWHDRLDIAGAGVDERVRPFGGGEPGRRGALRGGALLVLCGWAFFVVGGAAFAKVSEHWDQFTPFSVRHVPAIGYNATVGAAAVGLVVVGMGALLALPALVALLREGGWRQIRRPIVAALALVAVTVSYSVVTLAVYGGQHVVTGPGRLVGVTWAALVTVSIVALTVAAIAVVRRLPLSDRVLVAEGWLALLLALAMVVVLAGTALWWAATATSTTFLSGSRSGLFSTPGALSMISATATMLAGLVVTAAGATSVFRSLRSTSSPLTD